MVLVAISFLFFFKKATLSVENLIAFIISTVSSQVCLDILGRFPVSTIPSLLSGQSPLYPEWNGKCEHCCRKPVFLHIPLISLSSHEALTWVVHQFKRVDFFLLFFLPPSLSWQQLWHIGSVRNEKYSCRHAILVMKSQLDLLHDWFCNLLFCKVLKLKWCHVEQVLNTHNL